MDASSCIDNGCAPNVTHAVKRFAGRRLYWHRKICADMHGLDLDDDTWVARHTCDNPRCINPDHIVPGTRADNNRDMAERNMDIKGEGHHNCKLTDDQVAYARNTDIPAPQLAERWGVHKTLIHKIRRGEHR